MRSRVAESILLALGLLFSAVTAQASHHVLLSSQLLPARLQKTKKLLDSLVSSDPSEQPTLASRPLALSPNPGNAASRQLCDFALINRLISILAAEAVFRYTELTSLLVCELLVELLGLGGSCIELPEETLGLLKVGVAFRKERICFLARLNADTKTCDPTQSTFTQWSTRLKTALDADPSGCMELLEFQMARPPMDLAAAVTSGLCLITPQKRPTYSELSASSIPLGVSVKIWLSFYQCMCKLGLRKSALPTPLDWESVPALDAWPDLSRRLCNAFETSKTAIF
nr:hypothetical protein HK105_005296 [Polyrhizophydium stewartii]